VFTGAFTVTLNGACVTSSVTGTAASIVVPSDGNGILSLVGTLATSTLAQITVCSGGTLTLEATTEATLAAAISNTGTLVAYNFGTLVASGVISGTGALYVTGTGTLNLLGSNTYTGGTSVLDGKLIASSAASIPTNSSLTIGSDGGTAVCALTTTTQTFSLSQLNIYSGSTFNLNDNEVLIDYGASTDPITAIQSYLSTGYAGGTWNGTGINSGSVASADSNQSTLKYAVGYADGADDYTTAVSSGEIEILPTLAGDAKLQGNVVFGDYQILGQYFGHTNTSWDESDFTYNGTTNFGDFQMLAQDFGADASALSGYIADPSPPTVTLTLVASGGNWSVYANDTSDDNVGIASFDIDVVGDGGAEVTGSYEAAAYGSSGSHSAGFNVDASNGDDQNEDGAGDGMEILVSQNVLGYNGASTVIQGFGQSSGSEYGASWVQTGSGALIASGTYSGSGTLSVNVDSGGFIQVLNIVSAGVWSGQGNLADAAVTGDTISV
jgi:autotransporter-associated beta strand protein